MTDAKTTVLLAIYTSTETCVAGEIIRIFLLVVHSLSDWPESTAYQLVGANRLCWLRKGFFTDYYESETSVTFIDAANPDSLIRIQCASHCVINTYLLRCTRGPEYVEEVTLAEP